MSQNFKNAKIYKITNDYNDEVYVGSTCNTLIKRFSVHKCDAEREKNKNRPIYKLINELGFERFRIELICDYPCEDKYQLRQKEGEYIRQMGTLNKFIAGRTKHCEDYKQLKKEYDIHYREQNKDHLKILHQEYVEKNKDVIKEYKQTWFQNNKEKLKEHYNLHKDKINAKRREAYQKKKLLNNQNSVEILS
jgi:hypothetical protein